MYHLKKIKILNFLNDSIDSELCYSYMFELLYYNKNSSSNDKIFFQINFEKSHSTHYVTIYKTIHKWVIWLEVHVNDLFNHHAVD